MIELRNLCIQQGSFRLENVSLTVPAATHVLLTGRSGCGKTTLLEAACGLRPVASGHVLIAGREVTRLPPGVRGIGYVPQDGALFPHLTVRQHLGFALKRRGHSSQATAERVEELGTLLGLRALMERTPYGLSGGEAQRVALGRALAFRPPVLLMDEPMSALDDAARDELRAVLADIKVRERPAILHISHHRDDASSLADTILQLQPDGRLEAR